MIKLSIVIPAYNEENRIGPTLEKYCKFFSNKNTEILVVLNGCTDNTEQVVESFAKQFPDILSYINVDEAIGKGGAVHQGFLKAQGEIMGFVDADGATSAEEYQKLVSNIDNADGVIASRWLRESEIKNRTFIRKLASKVFVIVVKVIFKMPFSDTQCGAKLFKRQSLMKILPQLKETGMAFDVELLYVAYKNNLKIKEVPTVWVDQPGSPSLGSPFRVFSKGIKMIKTLFKIKKYGQTSNL